MRVKKMRMLLACVLVPAVLALTACSSSSGKNSGGAAPEGATGQSAEEILEEEPLVPEAEDDGKFHIGILTYRDHGAAEETINGFQDETRSLFGSDKVVFERVSADGDAGKCAEIATSFANSGYQLIFACGTEAVQNAGAAVKDVPIIGGCVSDYLLSEVVSSLDAPGGNITGVSCLGPVDAQVDQIVRITPWPQTVAIVSSGIESGSRFQESVAGQCLNEKQVSWKSYHAATEDGLRKAMELAAEECNCVYLPTDNFVASHMDIVRDVVLEKKILAVTGDYQMCSAGGLCCCSIDYYEHGRKAAGMAYAVLEQDEEISRMAVQDEDEWQEYYNPDIAAQLEWYDYGNMIPLQSASEPEESGEESEQM